MKSDGKPIPVRTSPPAGSIWKFRRAKALPRGGKTLIMGIVNLTPDSFSGGGGGLPSPARAVDAALEMLENGADLIDFGAESSRPGAVALAAGEEIRRLGETVRMLGSQSTAPISVDTYHAETAARVLDQGADMINDITALRGGWDPGRDSDPAMAGLLAREKAAAVLMHMPAPSLSMQAAAGYENVFSEVRDFLLRRADFALEAGIAPENIWLDPGFGFGKNFSHNRELLLRLNELASPGFPLLAGLSRKRMIADALGLAPGRRLEASLALALLAAWNGARAVRVHDVPETARALGMLDAVRSGLRV
ncbi:MAG: dihydropteroate synthase, partial [Planctomycetota bacterium]|nr:dihydropteroate synthase [Planctomycetota bacterium]